MKKTKENDEVNKIEIDTKNKNEKLAEEIENDVIDNVEILGKIVSAILWIVVILALAVLIMTVTSKRTSIFGYRMYLIMSGSMEPTIHITFILLTEMRSQTYGMNTLRK